LIFDSTGNLYGTASAGGKPGGSGTVFRLTRGANGKWKTKVLHSFSGGKDGGNSRASLIFDSVGKLYGTTSIGGTKDLGTVFELMPSTNGNWKEKVLYSFRGGTDGSGPLARLIFDSAGNLYGTTESGGNPYDNGTVFQLKPGTNGKWTEIVLYRFSNEGNGPAAGLIFDSAGNLYGTTYWSGAVFELVPEKGEWDEIVLHFFTGGTDGARPKGDLIFDSSGNLYGTASSGGNISKRHCLDSFCGLVFEITP
jgi:uncharacterized repeat protein (TIGR03803 family)